MQKISVYFNHRASHSSDYWKKQIRNALFRSEIIFRAPENLRELKHNLNEDIEQRVDSIVSVGGDGTVNTLIQDLAYKKVGLLVVPAGTANDLASELGNLAGLQKVIQYIRSEDYYYIDLIKINDRYMATNGGIGLGARVAHKINLIRQDHPSFKYLMRFTGKNIYSLFMANELLSMRATPIHILIESSKFKKVFNAPIVLINNQSILAGTFNIAPETNNSDGKFNVTIFCHPDRKLLVACIFKVMRGEIPREDPYFLSFETSHLYLENLNREKKVQFFGDGEIFEDDHCFDIHIAKSALKVYAHKRPCLQGEEIEKLH